MKSDSDQDRLRRLERKVDSLTWLMRLQTLLLALLAFAYVLQISRYLLLLLLIAVPVLVVFRRSLPLGGAAPRHVVGAGGPAPS